MSIPSPRPLLGCIADDFTGATDLANMLVRGGMRTVQSIGVPSDEVAATLDADAIVIALKSRTVPVEQAVADSLKALEWLRAQGCEQIFFKYCSTFDSTAAGNIGQVSEALLKALGSDFTLACPAFPENGRTVFRGHLFVQDQLLNESGMQHHPLTAMTDANLVRVLQSQTTQKVGLLRYDSIAQGALKVREKIAELRAQGVGMAIADALSDQDLYTLGTACSDLPLLTGRSASADRRLGPGPGAARELPPGRQTPRLRPDFVAHCTGGRSGLGRQCLHRHQRPGGGVDRCRPAVTTLFRSFALEHPDTVLIYATSPPDAVKAVQQRLGVERAGELVENALGEIAQTLRLNGVRRFVVAGGETSGAVVTALGVRLLQIGTQIDPGVPATVSNTEEPLALALKSGNFGGRDFFDKALKQLAGAAQ